MPQLVNWLNMGITGFFSFLIKWADHAPNIGYSKARRQSQLKPVSSAPLFWGLSPNSITQHAAWGSFYLPLLWPHLHLEPLVIHLHLPDKPFPWLTLLQSVRQSFNTALLWVSPMPYVSPLGPSSMVLPISHQTMKLADTDCILFIFYP